jgi:hypothetical protein
MALDFLLNMPLALLVFALGLLWLQADQPTTERPTLDVRGLLLAVATLSLLLMAVSLASAPTTRHLAGGVLLIGAITFSYTCVMAGTSPTRCSTCAKSPSLRLAMLIYLFVPGVFTGTNMIAVLYLHDLGFGAARNRCADAVLGRCLGRGDHTRQTQFQPHRPQTVADRRNAFAMSGHCLVDAHRAARRRAADHRLCLDGTGRQPVQRDRTDLGVCRHRAGKMAHSSALWNINRQLSFCLGTALLSSLLGALGGDGFRYCFLAAAVLTLLPMVAVLRFDASKVLALLSPPSLQEKST